MRDQANRHLGMLKDRKMPFLSPVHKQGRFHRRKVYLEEISKTEYMAVRSVNLAISEWIMNFAGSSVSSNTLALI